MASLAASCSLALDGGIFSGGGGGGGGGGMDGGAIEPPELFSGSV